MARPKTLNFNHYMQEIREAAVGIAFNSYAYYNSEGDGTAEIAKIEAAAAVLAKAVRRMKTAEA